MQLGEETPAALADELEFRRAEQPARDEDRADANARADGCEVVVEQRAGERPDRSDAAQRRDEQEGPAAGQPALLEDVVQVPAVGGRDAPPGELAAHDGRGRIGERQREQHQRGSDRDGRPFHGGMRREGGDDQAHEHAAAVAEVDGGGGQVEAQEAGQSSEQRRRRERFEEMPVGVGHGGERDADRRADRAEHAVHAVEQVQGVHRREEPEDRDRDCEEAERAADAEERDVLDDEIAAENEDRDCRELAEDLVAGAEIVHVVEESDGGDDRGRDQQGERGPQFAGEGFGHFLRDGAGREQREGGRSEEGQPADHRDGARLDFAAAIRGVHEAHGACERAGHPGEEQARPDGE